MRLVGMDKAVYFCRKKQDYDDKGRSAGDRQVLSGAQDQLQAAAGRAGHPFLELLQGEEEVS